MSAINMYVMGAIVGVTGVVSWMFSWETLFLLGFISALALAVVVGTMIGLMTLTERISDEFARERAAWRNVRAGTEVPHR